VGFERYLLWNDAIYGSSNNRFGFDNNFPSDCSLAANSLVWTVRFISLK